MIRINLCRIITGTVLAFMIGAAGISRPGCVWAAQADAHRAGSLRLAVLLTETLQGTDQTPTAAGDAVSKAFMAKGFHVVDRADLMASKAAAVQQQVEKGDTSGVASLGKDLDAELLVFGSVEGTSMENTNLNISSVRATLSAKAYQAQSGTVLASAAKTASGVDAVRAAAVTEAFSKVGQMAGEELASAVLDAMKENPVIGITLSKAPGMEAVDQVIKGLSAARGVSKTALRSFKDGQARLETEIRGISSGDLAALLEKLPGLKIHVKTVTAESVTAEME
jgi:hypothetical protein